MAKVTRILALLTIVALVAALPISVVAQNDAPHVFIGTAIVNGLTATTGVPITAWDGDTQIGSTTVTAGGKFKIRCQPLFRPDNLQDRQCERRPVPSYMGIWRTGNRVQPDRHHAAGYRRRPPARTAS